ncbi:MAG: transporter substrate-binding protein [Belnapia sp.]|nr:transporter substrate-binding protein [Belnapia sp.]
MVLHLAGPRGLAAWIEHLEFLGAELLLHAWLEATGASVIARLPIAQPWYAFPGTDGVRVTEAIIDPLARVVEQRAAPEAALAGVAREMKRLLPR